jgi:NAD+ synthase (glutamine-hydrolysing)
VPADPATRDERCHEVYEIQVQGLVKRLRAMKADKVVIGISGGLDSTQALIVCARAMDVMGFPRSHILAYTMPGFATSERTLDQSRRLMSAVGATASEVDIRPSCIQMFKDIGHPFAEGKPVYDVTFENVQAGSVPVICSGWPTCTTCRWWEPATCPSWRWDGAPTAWVITWLTIT